MPIEDSDIEDLAAAPKTVTTDGMTVTERDISEVIAAQQHAAQQTGASRAHRGLRFTKLKPPGAGPGSTSCE